MGQQPMLELTAENVVLILTGEPTVQVDVQFKWTYSSRGGTVQTGIDDSSLAVMDQNPEGI
jgi:hypothetical protein